MPNDPVDTSMKTVPERLAELGKLYQQRNQIYGDNYKEFGAVLLALFPDGIALKTEEEMCRMGMFIQVLSKVTRYAKQFDKGGHADSLDDIAVYSQMLQEYDDSLNL